MSEMIENFNHELVLDHLIRQIEGSGKLYGPAFVRMAVRFAVEFEAGKLGEDPPDIETLDDLKKYLLDNFERYPFCYCPAIYGLVKAESTFQGAPGSDTRRTAVEFAKKMDGQPKERGESSLTTAIENFMQMTLKMNVTVPSTVEGVDANGAAIVSIERCPYKDVCFKFEEEGITKMIGGKPCVVLRVLISAVSLMLNEECEYHLDEFNTPRCRGRVFIL